MSTPAQRAAAAGYMVSRVSFRCGNCAWITAGGYCAQPRVQQSVDVKHGCCNLFVPMRASDLVFAAGKVEVPQ